MKVYILYNPKAGNGQREDALGALDVVMDEETEAISITSITNYRAFLDGLKKDDKLIIAGGDGTLNRFVNDTDGLQIENELLYFPMGTGNDFACDVNGGKEALIDMAQYLADLPTVQIGDRKYRFLNAVGYGLDGYCCQVGDELRRAGKKVNYTAIAIKGLLFGYKPTKAAVTVDGQTYTYDKVWIAPTMNGRFYGGGMMATPEQDRLNPKRMLSLMVFHSGGRLRTLMAFPSIFKGKHVKYGKMVDILEGREISVEFNRPVALQIDGETVLNVTGYAARSAKIPEKV